MPAAICVLRLADAASGYHGPDVSIGERMVSNHWKRPLLIPGHNLPSRAF
jgi:hypothetical protein